MAEWRELSLDEEIPQEGAPPTGGGFALPVPQDPELGELQQSLFEDVKGAIQSDSDPRFARLRFGPEQTGGGSEAPPVMQEERNWQELEAPPAVPFEPEEEKPGYISNIARLTGQRALNLVGSGVRFIGEVGEDLNTKMGAGQFVWGDGKGFRYVNAEEFEELKKNGVSENLLTETLPMAFQDRDLGGEKTSSPERIKEGWKNGDVGEVAAATGTFIAETFTESIPDMIATIWAMPLYIGARSQEIAEERVRNERLSEALAANQELSPQAAGQIATGYVQTEDVDTGDIAKAAPFAALSALLERIGAKGITGAGDDIAKAAAAKVAAEATEYGMRYALKEGAKAGAKEATTEFFQEGVIEYFGEKFGTSEEGLLANLDVAEGAERGAWAALAGYGGGQVAGTGAAGMKSLLSGKPIPETDETGKPIPPTTPDDTGGSGAETPTDGISQAEREALEGVLDAQAGEEAAQSTLDLGTPPAAPAQEQATTPTPTPTAAAPVAPVPQEALPDAADQPTAEPVGDIAAQINDMVEGNRDAVYLSPEQGLAPENLPEGVQVLENFDDKGGTLITKDAGVAEGAMQAKNAGAGMQDIIGQLTRAGEGKPAQGVVVQLRDEEGNVARESAVATVEEAAALQAEWGEGAVIVSTEEALARREEGVAADEAAAEPVKNPMIQEKDVVKGFRELITRIKGGKGVTAAFRKLGTAINTLFPDAKNLPPLKGSIGAPRIGKYFATLDEEIAIDESLPNLKGFLAEVMASPDEATAVQNINRLTDYVASTGGTLATEGVKGTVAEQGAKGISQYDVAEAQRLANKYEYNFKTKEVDEKGEPVYEKRTRISGPANRLPARAGVVANLATTVKALVNEAAKRGINFPEETNDLIKRAERYLEKSMVAKPVTQKSGTSIGTVSTPQEFRGKNLDEVGGKLRKIAESLTKQLAEADTKTPKKADTKAKVEETSAVTEAPAKPEKAENAKKPTLEAKVKKVAKEKAEVKIGELLAKKPEDLTYNELRRVAKHLGIKAVGKKPDLVAAVKAWDETAAEAVAGPTVTTKKEQVTAKAKAATEATATPEVKVTTKKPKKIANPDKVMDEGPAPKAELTRGRGITALVEGLGFPAGTSLAEALSSLGLSKQDAEIFKGVVNSVPDKAQGAILEAVKEYQVTGNDVRFLAQLAEAAGKKELSSAQQLASLNFTGGLLQFTRGATKVELAEDAALADEEARAEGWESAEEKAAYEDETGWGGVYEEMDGMNYEEVRNLVDNLSKPVSNKDMSALQALRDVLGPVFEALTHLQTKNLEGADPNLFIGMNDLLDLVIENMPKNSKFHALATQLRKLDLNVPVHFFLTSSQFGGTSELTQGKFFWSETEENNIITIVSKPENFARQMLTIFHEMVHAATSLKYHGNKPFKEFTDELFRQALSHLPDNFSDPKWAVKARAAVNAANEAGLDTVEATQIIEAFILDAAKNANRNFMKFSAGTFYGLYNPTEFLAEASANPNFQAYLSQNRVVLTREVLKGKVGGPRRPNILTQLINAIQQLVLKISPRNSILKEVMLLSAREFMTQKEAESYYATAGYRQRDSIAASYQKMHGDRRGEESRTLEPEQERTRNETVDAVRNTRLGIAEQAASTADKVKHAGKSGHLAISGRDAIERDNRALFDKAAKKLGIANPLTAFNDAKNHAQTLARKFEKRAHSILKSFRDISKEARALMEVQMRDITMGNIDPTQPLNSAANRHIWTKGGKNKKPKIRKEFYESAKQARDGWLAFSKRHPKAAATLQTMAKLTKEIHDTKVSYALTALGEAFGFDAATNEALGKAKTSADIDALIPPKEVEQLAAILDTKKDKEGKKEAKKQLAAAEARAAAASSAKTILHESSIKGWYFPLRRYGNFVVSTGPDVTGKDRYVSFHESQKEAEKVANEINAISSDENQVGVSLKLETTSHTADVKSVLSDLKRRIKDPDTGAKLDGALSEILAANATYQSQIKRQNVDGAAANDMARGFEEYVSVSKYSLGDIRMAHRVSEAIKGMNLIATDLADSGLTTDERIQAGRVKDEITKRNKAEGGDRKKNRFQKVVGNLGFLNFLGAPSYWALNSTQTYVVTLPYVMAKYGEIKGPAALLKAQAVVTRAAAATMKGNDKSYEGFKKNLPPDARRVVEALEGDNIIQSTIAHEFGDMLDPRGFKRMRDNAMLAPVGKTAELALNVMEKVPEGIEHFNRISTALAVYSLSNGDYVATRDAVNETQMNYDTNNRARLLKTLPGDTAGVTSPLVTPIMMFKTFGVGMAKLYYGAIFDTVYKKGGRLEALKLAGYLMGTHTLFGGVAGGLMVAPIQLAIWALNQTLEPDDEWKMEDAAAAAGQELWGDFGATMFERGLPAAALGVDMSRSINLGNLIWMGNDRLDYTEFGALEQGIASVFGPVASYATNATREGLRVLTDDPRGGMDHFIQAAFPVKMGSGITEAWRYSQEGMRTSGELELIPAEEFSGFLRTAFGFQTAQKAETKDEYYSDMRLEMRRSARKNDLVKHANNAIMQNDWDKLDKILEDMQTYNLSVPKPEYRVTARDMAMLRSRRRTAQFEYNKKFRYSN